MTMEPVKNLKRALTLTEVLIALSIGIAILVPTIAMFSTSGRLLEKSSNVGFAAGLARYLIQGMMTMKIEDVVSIPLPGISCCDDSPDNVYFKDLFFLKKNCGSLKKGLTGVNLNNTPNLYKRLAKYQFRYTVSVVDSHVGDDEDDVMKSVSVYITWKEFGVDKTYRADAYIVPR